MKKTIAALHIFIFFVCSAYSQNHIKDLYGFRIGQFRSTLTNELGKPFQSGTMDHGNDFESFNLNTDSTLILVVEYLQDHPNLIYSLEIYGTDDKTNIGFKGLKLGMKKNKVIKNTGKPDQVSELFHGGEFWEFGGANYNMDMNAQGLLGRVKIIDTYTNKVPNKSTSPSIRKMAPYLISDDNAVIANYLSPAITINYLGTNYEFQYSLQKEIATDTSGVFEAVRMFGHGLEKIDMNDPEIYKEDVIDGLSSNPIHFVKIKLGHEYLEINFQYIDGEYVLWKATVKNTL